MLYHSRSVRASIVIVEYSTRTYLPRCLDSIRALDFPRDEVEVLVVDNASPTPFRAIAADFPWVRLLESRENLGFAGACCLALPECRGDAVVLVNPDVEVHPGFLLEVLAPLSDPEIGIVGSKIYYPGTRVLQHAGGLLFPNGRSEHRGRGEPDVGQYDELEDVDYVTGAAMAIRRDVIDRVGFVSPAYFPAYYEETELCVRARAAGLRVVYAPRAVVSHHEAVASGGGGGETFLRRYHTNRIRFVLRNYSLFDLVSRFLPAEAAFQRSLEHAPVERGICVRAYAQALVSVIRQRAS